MPMLKPIVHQLATALGAISLVAITIIDLKTDTINVLQLINAQNVLSVLVVVVVVGGGKWFVKDVWPWICDFLEAKQKSEHEIKLKELAVSAEAEMRWQAVVERMTHSYATFQNTLGKVEATNHQILEWMSELRKADAQTTA